MRILFLFAGALAGVTAAAVPPPGKALLGRGQGWITTAYWETSASEAVTEFRSTWRVPPEPDRRGGQLIYLFNGITNGPHTAILQPVLQWGVSPAGGGQYWAVASWYVTNSGAFRHSALIPVRPGDTLVGVMTGSGSRYDSYFEGIPGTELTVENVAPLVWLSETLEAYATSGCDDYPRGAVAFYDIGVRTVAGLPDLAWQTWTPGADCGQRTDIVSHSPQSGEVRVRVGR